MTSIVQHGVGAIMIVRSVEIPDYNSARFNNVTSIERLPSEPVEAFTLRLQNIVVGSRYRVEVLVGGATATPTLTAEGVAGAATVDLVLDLYAPGNVNNDLRIKVRNASGSPAYRAFETQAVAQAGVVTVYISQQLDE